MLPCVIVAWHALAALPQTETAPPRASALNSTPVAQAAVCFLQITGPCLSVNADIERVGWFEEQAMEGPSSPEACAARAIKWRDECGPTAGVSLWYRSSGDDQVHRGVSSLRKCLPPSRGATAMCRPGAWPTVISGDCPAGLARAPVGVCYNASQLSAEVSCPTGAHFVGGSAFCAPKFAHEDVQLSPRLTCYSERYADVKAQFCANRTSECMWRAVLRHYRVFGRVRGRFMHCGHGGKTRKTVQRAAELDVIDRHTHVRCYLQRYAHVRQRFCRRGEDEHACTARWTGDATYERVMDEHVRAGHAKGLRFGCDTTASTPVSLELRTARSIKVVIPGHGTAARTPTLLRSIGILRSNTPANVNFCCAIYVYNTSLTVYPKGSVPLRERCKVCHAGRCSTRLPHTHLRSLRAAASLVLRRSLSCPQCAVSCSARPLRFRASAARCSCGRTTCGRVSCGWSRGRRRTSSC